MLPKISSYFYFPELGLEASEQDDIIERESRPSNRAGNSADEGGQDPLRNEDVAQEGESDTEYNFHEAETESDSDDNQSTQDAQRSVQTGATAGSDTGDELKIVFFWGWFLDIELDCVFWFLWFI